MRRRARRPHRRRPARRRRVHKPRLLTGAASLGIAKLLRRRGCRMAAPAESFFVGTDPADAGPGSGELDRAEAWGAALGAAAHRTVP